MWDTEMFTFFSTSTTATSSHAKKRLQHAVRAVPELPLQVPRPGRKPYMLQHFGKKPVTKDMISAYKAGQTPCGPQTEGAHGKCPSSAHGKASYTSARNKPLKRNAWGFVS